MEVPPGAAGLRPLVSFRLNQLATISTVLVLDAEKPLCKMKKAELAKWIRLLAADSDRSRLICLKCGRMAPSKQLLCKPKPIKKIASE